MVCPRSHPRPATTVRNDDLTKLSGEVLRLRLEQLNLPITGTRPRLIERLRAPTTPAPARPKRRPSRGRGNKNVAAPVSHPRVHTRKPRTVEAPEPTAEGQLSDSDEYVSDAGSSVGELFEERMEDFEPDQAHDRDLVFTPAQLAAIQDTVSSTVQAALSSFPNCEAPARMYLDQSTPSPRSQNVATPLDLNRPMDKSLEDKILRDFCLLLPDTIYRSQSPPCSCATKSPPQAPRAPRSPWLNGKSQS